MNNILDKIEIENNVDYNKATNILVILMSVLMIAMIFLILMYFFAK
jgi:hypothetical protein